MAYQTWVQPELFALAGVGLFLTLSLMTYFGENRFPRKIPYVYQFAALLGLLCLVVSRFVFANLEETMRLWYCCSYLVAALANVVATNIYLVSKKQAVSRKWAAAITVPSLLIGGYFIAEYSLAQISMVSSIAQISVLVSTIAIVIGVSISVIHRISHNTSKRTGEVI